MKNLIAILTLGVIAMAQSSSTGTFTLQLSGNTVWVAGAGGCPVAGKPTASCALPTMIVGVPYSVALAVTGGIAPYTWAQTGLPSCLTLTPSATDTATATITGMPTLACTGSGKPLSVTVTDSSPKQLATITGTVTVASK